MIESILKEKLIVKTTANVYTMGQLNKNTQSIWIVFHGYGQMAEHFIRKFSFLEQSFIIAPEATNYFYLQGTSGRIGANWMTAYEREDAIKDYINYLNEIAYLYQLNQKSHLKINLLGFSQGVATLSRWYSQINFQINNIILWGALIPDSLELKNQFNPSNTYCVYGDEDVYIKANQEYFDKQLKTYENLQYKIIRYRGGHRIPISELKGLYTKLWK
ncbi:alpha/beta hydrolase [Acidiluteibacter ferrifornacis]|uniref:Alpha/beta hydrolase n=1 Tax=Acidiluteibacter ferrifornacis TaxID=2692424 RepID=A0A6N9NJ73_9FLAO|nr:alpha/beta hydrolase [Acidiluteibacter ferrifornacis]MBR9831935.1 alpha/beta hydrolase [bacterium]NBG65250.1 alpha/beta hydrolase [Acidiluteibacter ferrifornacis]